MSKPNKTDYEEFKYTVEFLKEQDEEHYLSVINFDLQGLVLSNWVKDALDSLRFYFNKKAP
mgnify:CR=1 FL=1